MTPMASALRVPRALVFATACLAVSGGGHALAGGGPIPVGPTVLGAVIAFCLAYMLNGRERGLEVVLPATAGTQILLHELFTRAAPAPHTTSVAADHGHPGWGMTVVHLVVASLTGWWLHRGESALWLMIRLCGMRMPVIRLFVTVVETSWQAWRAVPTSDVRPYGGWEICPALRRRGPPTPGGVG
ncbi:hypothetical protein ACQPYK_17980 [Streptosporangium sp. CA-135522]|uniref:hypothetical protein n=1 Tax=Streptosporangium sp. CA-135522 TaxID=3240072 RepID=UPI003D905243